VNTSFGNFALADAFDLLGRALLALLFILEGWSKLDAYGAAAGYMAAYGLPSALLPAAIAIEIGAGSAVLLGWRTRIAACLLAGFCIVAAAVFHTKFSDRNQLIHFEKDLALAGAFIIVWARGAGRLSLDALKARRKGQDTPPCPAQRRSAA
jgi:putative oxidoreductase